MTKIESKIISLKKAIDRLEEVIRGYHNEKDEKMKIIFRDSAIQRFEICFDLSWKTLKGYLLESKGIVCVSPKTCFREAFLNGIISNGENGWIQMTDDRNLMSHIYNESEAEKIFIKLFDYLVLFKELLEKIKK